MKEVELFPAIQSMFDKYEVFAEVPAYRCRPDVVVRKGKEITVIEMKTSLSKQLASQAIYWMNKCDYIYVAVPKPKRVTNNPTLAFLIDHGIGVIYVKGEEATIHSEAKRQTFSYRNYWDRALLDIYKEGIGGSTAVGGYMTGYKYMIICVKRYMVRVGVPVSAQQIVNNVSEVREHYSRPVPSIRDALGNYEEEWCNKQCIGNKVYFTANIKRTPIKEKTCEK